MDGAQQEQASPNEPRKNLLLEGIEFGVGGALIGITTFLLLLFVLNYFNIISLSQVFPKYFGFLPHRASPNPPAGGEGGQPLQGLTLNNPEQSRRASPTPTPVKITLSCPVAKEFCSSAKPFELNLALSEQKQIREAYLGWMLPKNSPILAAFDGTITTQDSVINASASSRLVTLFSADGRYEAKYLFIPRNEDKEIKNDTEVKTGDALAFLSDATLLVLGYNDINIRFNVVDKEGESLDVKTQDFGNLVLP